MRETTLNFYIRAAALLLVAILLSLAQACGVGFRSTLTDPSAFVSNYGLCVSHEDEVATYEMARLTDDEYFNIARDLFNNNDKDGIKYMFVAIFMMPEFQMKYVTDNGSGPVQRLGPYELAARLSFYLTGSTFDDELLAKASDGTILDPEVLAQEALRLLNDPKFKSRFVERWAGQWLLYRNDIGSSDTYGSVSMGTVAQSIHLYVEEALDNNYTLGQLLNGGYLYVDQTLAAFYGLENPGGDRSAMVSDGFTRVSDDLNGSLFSQAYFLHLTSNEENSRRRVLKKLGIAIWLPYLESIHSVTSIYARAQSPGPQRFFSVFWPNGSYMPDGDNGVWHFGQGGVLGQYLGNFKNNAIIPRGFSHGTSHVRGQAQFLTGRMTGDADGEMHLKLKNGTSAPSGTKSIDQYIADKISPGTPIHSLHTGLEYGVLGHHGYWGHAARAIAWSDWNRPIVPTYGLGNIFDKIYAPKAIGDMAADVKAKKMSYLDFVLDQITDINRKISPTDKSKLDLYLEQVRSIEREVQSDNSQLYTCSALDSLPASMRTGTGQSTNKDNAVSYLKKINTLHVLAHKCDFTRVSTMVLDVNIGLFGGFDSQHGPLAHRLSKGDDRVTGFMDTHGRFIDVIGDLVQKLNNEGLLESTIVFAGSDQSAPENHNGYNIPTLLVGKVPQLRWGQEVGSGHRAYADLLVDLMAAYGVHKSNFGNGKLGPGNGGSGILR